MLNLSQLYTGILCSPLFLSQNDPYISRKSEKKGRASQALATPEITSLISVVWTPIIAFFCIEKPGHQHNTARSWLNAASDSAIFKIIMRPIPKIC